MHDGIVGGTGLGQVMPDGLTQAPGDVDFNTKNRRLALGNGQGDPHGLGRVEGSAFSFQTLTLPKLLAKWLRARPTNARTFGARCRLDGKIACTGAGFLPQPGRIGVSKPADAKASPWKLGSIATPRPPTAAVRNKALLSAARRGGTASMAYWSMRSLHAEISALVTPVRRSPRWSHQLGIR